MEEFWNGRLKAEEELFARALGWIAINHFKEEGIWEEVSKTAENSALQALNQIQAVLNNDSIDDSNCLLKIDEIVTIFYSHGLDTSRHDWE